MQNGVTYGLCVGLDGISVYVTYTSPLMKGTGTTFFETCHLDNVEKDSTQCVGGFCNKISIFYIEVGSSGFTRLESY